MVVEKGKANLLRKWRNGMESRKIVPALLCLLIVLIEIFVMNFKYWESGLYEPVEDAVCSLQGLTAVNGRYEITEEETVIEFSGVDVPVAYLGFVLEPELQQQAQITVAAVDDANASYLYAPVRIVRGDVARSQYLRLHFSGNAQNIKVIIRGLQGSSIRQDAVKLNARVPFLFSWQRALALTAAALCLYLLRPGSVGYTIQTDLTRKRQWLCTAAVLGIGLLIFYRMLQWNTGALAWPEYMEHHQQYYRLTEALLEGRADIGEAPQLQEIANPYDPAARAAAGLGLEDFKWDHAYYQGHYYVYFGIVPVLLLYLPWYVLTGSHLPNADAVFCLGGLLMVGIAYFLWQVIRRWFPRTPYPLYLLLWAAMGAASCLGYAVYKPDLYLVPILAGIACGVWGLAFWISAEQDGSYRAWRLGAGSFCIALIAGCRPQMLLVLPMGVILFWKAVWKERKLFSKTGMAHTLALCLPFVLAAAGIMGYNALRFGSVWDFGANYNLTTNDMTNRGWVWGRCGLGIFSYLLQPLRISSVFPFLQDFPVETVYQGLTVSERMIGGVLWLFPVLCFGVYGLGRKKWFADRSCYAYVWASQLLALALVVADTQMAGLLTRYFGDFVWIAMIGSVFTILAGLDWQNRQQADSSALLRLVVLACVLTLVFSFLRIFAHSEDSIRSANPALYYSIQYLISFWM